MTSTDHQAIRLRWDGTGLQTGDALLLCPSAADFVVTYTDFVTSTHLPDDALVSDPTVLTPLPRYPVAPDDATAADDTGVAALWPEVSPAMLWHPLLWLPVWLWPARDEGEISWAVRVALVMQSCGLYTPESGWRDVAIDHGVDLTNPEVQIQAGRWLRGESSDNDVAAALDGLSLTNVLPDPPERSSWATVASAAAPSVQRRAWALLATDLLRTVRDIPHSGVAQTEQISEVVQLGSLLLGQIPIDQQVREGGDAGAPVVLTAPDSPAAVALQGVADALAARQTSLVGRSLGLTPAR